MSGQDRFQRQTEEMIGGIRVIQTVHAKILNMDDPDVRYACGTGPFSAGPDYAEVMKRGREKAVTSFERMPESLTAEAQSWAKSLAPFSGTTLRVEIDGRYDSEPTGRAALGKDGPRFHFTAAGVLASLDEPGLDGQILGIKQILPLMSDLGEWLLEARERIARARIQVGKIAALGVNMQTEE